MGNALNKLACRLGLFDEDRNLYLAGDDADLRNLF